MPVYDAGLASGRITGTGGTVSRPGQALVQDAVEILVTGLIPAAEREIAAARRQLGAVKKARDAIPAKLPANEIDPQAQVRCCAPPGAACR